MSTRPQFLVERQEAFGRTIGAPPRVLEAYMGEVVWPHPHEVKRHGLDGNWPNVRPKLPSMVRVVVVLLRQRDDQHKVGLSWM